MFEQFAQESTAQERIGLKFALTDTNLDQGTFKGMASVFGSMVDSWMPTIIEPGAFTKTLQEQGKRVKILWQHNMWDPIGIPTLLQETDLGLQIEGKVSQTEHGKDCLTLMRDGVVDELSIGFDPIKWEMEDKGNGEVVRHIKEVRLWEVSPVTFGADPQARIQSVHSAGPYLGTVLERLMNEIRPLAEVMAAKWEIQTLICPKSKWKNLAEAKAWLKNKGYKTSSVDTTEDSWRFRQRDPKDFGKMRTICINPGKDANMEDCKVKAVYGQLKTSKSKDSAPGPMDAHENRVLSAKNRKLLADALATLKSILSSGDDIDDDDSGDDEEDSLSLALNQLLALMPLEAHESKVLSKKNKKLLADAVTALKSLLAAAEPPDDEDDNPDDDQALTVNAEQLARRRELELQSVLASL